MSTTVNVSLLDISNYSLLDMPRTELAELIEKLVDSDVSVVGGVNVEERRRHFAGPPLPRRKIIFDIVMRMKAEEFDRRDDLIFGPKRCSSSASMQAQADSAFDIDPTSDSDIDSDSDASLSGSSVRSLKRKRGLPVDYDSSNDGDVDSDGDSDGDYNSDKENVAPPLRKRLCVYRDMSPALSDSSSRSSRSSKSTASSESIQTPTASPVRTKLTLSTLEPVRFYCVYFPYQNLIIYYSF